MFERPLRRPLTTEEEAGFHNMRKAIDRQLGEHGHARFDPRQNAGLPDRVVQEIIDHYEAEGWRVTQRHYRGEVQIERS